MYLTLAKLYKQIRWLKVLRERVEYVDSTMCHRDHAMPPPSSFPQIVGHNIIIVILLNYLEIIHNFDFLDMKSLFNVPKEKEMH